MNRKGHFLIVLLAFSGVQCGRDEAPPVGEKHVHSGSSPATNVVQLPAAAQELAGIEVQQAKSRECKSVLKAMGKMLAPPPQTAIVAHAFPARVARIHVKIGDRVEKDQPLVTLESYEVGTAKTDFYKAIADCELAKVTFDREKRLLETGIGVKKNFLAAEGQYKIAEANREAAHKKLHVLGFTEEQVQEVIDTHQISPTITLYAPIAGKVISHVAVLGDLVDESTEILTIIDPTMLWVDAEIYEKDIAKIRIGQDVKVRVPAYPGEEFPGKVIYIGDVVAEATRTITVRAEVANDDCRLKPGMFADVDIFLNGNRKMLVVPAAAILEESHKEGHRKIVFVKEKDHFVCREIETGAPEGDCRQITKGLKAGEEVVVSGNHQLMSKLKEEILHQAHDMH